jgi:predicted metal-dependent phosphoesterase TrpH
MPYKIDLHTHSILSQDGSIRATEYQQVLESGKLDYIAVTDHNQLSFALELNRKLGDRIIPGEEIKTVSGEVIGLYLSQEIAPGLSLKETITAIRSQGGLVYIPHPFTTYKSGLDLSSLESILSEIDILETYNARSFNQNSNLKAQAYAAEHHLAAAAGSDSHSSFGLGRCYNMISSPPNLQNLVQLLKDGQQVRQRALLREFLAPSINRLNKGLKLIPDK